MKRRAVIDDAVEQYGKYCSTFSFKLQKGETGETPKEGFLNCYVSPDRYKLVYMHVDKCGSTSITTAFKNDNYYFYPLENFLNGKKPDDVAKFFVEDGYEFFTFSRDPVKRWISGLNEFMCRYKPPSDWLIKQVIDKKYIYEEHTVPQKIFSRLCNENGGRLTTIRMDGNLKHKLNLFLESKLIDKDLNFKPVKLPHLRSSKNFIPNYTTVCKKLYEQFIEPDPEEFNKLYKDDYETYKDGI